MTEPQIQQLVDRMSNMLGLPIRSPLMHRPEEVGLEYEEVFFPSMDGYRLEGWFFPAESNELVICNHPLWFSRSGFPGHLDPWKSLFGAAGNDFECNFMPDYVNLHHAGYNVLCYDLRNFGRSASANGGICGNGLLEYRDVIGSLQFVQSRQDLSGMTKGLYSRCVGGNSTMIAMSKHPDYFRDIRCMVNPQPISMAAFFERTLANLGLSDRLADFELGLRKITGFTINEMSPLEYAKDVLVPTFITQVRDDVMTRPSDVQEIFDRIPVTDKKLFWIEDTTRRFDGYNYFAKNPQPMLDWFNLYMK